MYVMLLVPLLPQNCLAPYIRFRESSNIAVNGLVAVFQPYDFIIRLLCFGGFD